MADGSQCLNDIAFITVKSSAELNFVYYDTEMQQIHSRVSSGWKFHQLPFLFCLLWRTSQWIPNKSCKL